MNKKGFTLFEALIAVSIFVIIGSLAGTAYVYNVQNHKYLRVEKELVSDAQFLIERISKEFQDSTFDYEEYYNQLVLSGEYGENHGEYAKRFYNNLNINTGQNPPLTLGLFSEFDQLVSAATCDPYCGVGGCDPSGCLKTPDPWLSNELSKARLYLITGDGLYKTIFEFRDGALRYKKFVREEGEEGAVPVYAPLFDDFVQLSPPRTEIASIQFYMAPIEDPRRAFAESDLSVQMQPHLTVYLKIQPAQKNQQGLDKDRIPTLELQTTLSSRVYNTVP